MPSSALRVLFDDSLAANPAGTGVFARGLLGALDGVNGIEVVRSRFDSDSIRSVDVTTKPPLQRGLNAINHLRYFAFELPARARRARCEVIFSPGTLGPLRGSIPAVVTVLDLSPLRYAATIHWVNRFYLRAMLRIQLRRSAGVCTISEAIGHELRQRFPGLATPIHVIPVGPNQELLATAPRPLAGIDAPFFLMVGTLEPRKNHQTAIEAFSAYLREHPRSSDLLVLAGSPGWLFQPILDTIRRLDLEQRVVRVGQVDVARLRWLYEGARALVFPSLYEGFGIPVLEAFALGCPVLASRIPAVVEVVGDAPAVLLDPLDVTGWASAMAAVAQSARDPKALDAARARAASFSWEASASRLSDALHIAALR